MNHHISAMDSHTKAETAYSGNNVAFMHGNPLDKTVVRICTIVCNKVSGIAGRPLEVRHLRSQCNLSNLGSFAILRTTSQSPPPLYLVYEVQKYPPTSTQACTLVPTSPTLPTHNPLLLGYIWPSSSPSFPAQARSCSESRN